MIDGKGFIDSIIKKKNLLLNILKMKTQDVLNKLEQLNYEDLVKTKKLIEE